MSAENVANEQLNDTKRVAGQGAKLVAKIISETKKGLNPTQELQRFMNESGDKLNLKLSELQQSGLLDASDVSSIRDTIKPLSSFKDLEDGCYKCASMDEITEKLNVFQNTPGSSKEDLMKGIKNCSLAPDSIRMNTKGSPSLEVIKANVSVKANQHGTMLAKETLNKSRRQMKVEMAKAVKAGTRAGAAVGKTAGKGAATAVLGTATGGISLVAQAFTEVFTATGRAVNKTIGMAQEGMERVR